MEMGDLPCGGLVVRGAPRIARFVYVCKRTLMTALEIELVTEGALSIILCAILLVCAKRSRKQRYTHTR
jgi:hypothetical protein